MEIDRELAKYICQKVVAFAGDGCPVCVRDTAVLFIDSFWTVDSNWRSYEVADWICEVSNMISLPDGYGR